jgi:hypothetical protein
VSDTHPLTFVDVFAGCGGLSVGLMQAGWTGAAGVFLAACACTVAASQCFPGGTSSPRSRRDPRRFDRKLFSYLAGQGHEAKER